MCVSANVRHMEIIYFVYANELTVRLKYLYMAMNNILRTLQFCFNNINL